VTAGLDPAPPALRQRQLEDHFGTVREAQFPESHAVTDLATFCAQFITH